MGQKITLDEVRAGGSTKLTIYCLNHAVQYSGCFHSADMPLLLALSLWRGERRLDELPLKCSRCDSRKVDVRCDHPRDEGMSDELHKLLNQWREANER
ncbi:hypothetical protein U91I_02746 [alpha proteobacterium U9-1i]|nr:hypothetical protein U91I_02746 [alpha proteobacterium U9-1i]